ncbi:AAA family ATPase [Arenibacter algicola]|uniref:5-methylcytosine-specific restriction enzyme B n=1 Tax=Arenibacter algicola TaxID=616991 RepID=A0A221UYV8_9FLAO|nr:AAA family ATPase [Arenibacter algicola]ASO06549.1 5-methylcytosine-specific restriction enzyme B [Arenibacter algicola]
MMNFHETVLKKLIEYRETHSNFNFLTRQRSGAAKRFESGHWFQGNDKYAFVGLINASGGINKTRSVGLVFKPKEYGFDCTLQVRFNGENRKELITCYNKLISQIGGFGEKDSERFDKNLGRVSHNFSELFEFLDINYQSIISIFEKNGCKDVLVSDEKFKNLISNIDEQRGYLETKKYWLYAPGENAREWDDFYEQGIMALGWDDLGDLTKYNSKDEIVKALQNLFNTDSSKKNDATANYDFVSEMNIGDVVFVKKGTSKLLGYGVVESDYLFDVKRRQFKHVRKMNWKKKGLWEAGHNLAIKTLTNISDYPSPDTNYSTYHERLMAIINGNQSSDKKTVNMDYPLNTILYGPPGTGKTYKTKETALKILGISTENLTRTDIKNKYDEKAEEGRIVFTTFHQSMSYEDFVEGIKPVTINDGQLVYNVESGIFKTICKKAEDNYWDSQKGLTKELPFDKAFEMLEEEWQENEEMKFPLRTEGYDFTITGFSDRSIRFKKASGGTGHTLSISTLRDVYYGKREVKVTGVGIYYPGILAKLKSYKPEANSSEKDLKNYVLIIDEINRGNVSAIFGELITLLEPDKRLGEAEEITLKLPYSKDETFGVPPNLHIIGTMNTADRSVEALDTALRRRFVFEEVMPDPVLLKDITFDGFNLEQLLTAINDRVEVLLDRDHTIGHSYFIKLKSGDRVGLSNVFKNNIIPLLQEYFYNDYEKIALVLGSGFVEEKGAKKVTFPKYTNIAVPDLEQSYELITKIEDIEEAVGLLLGVSNE